MLFHHLDRDAHGCGHLRVGEIVDALEGEGLATPGLEGVEGVGLQVLQDAAGVGDLVDVCAVCGQRRDQVQCDVGVGVAAVARAPMLQHHVVSDAVHQQCAVADVRRVAVGQQAEQRFLGEVGGGVRVTNAPAHVGEQVCMQQADGLVEARPARCRFLAHAPARGGAYVRVVAHECDARWRVARHTLGGGIAWVAASMQGGPARRCAGGCGGSDGMHEVRNRTE